MAAVETLAAYDSPQCRVFFLVARPADESYVAKNATSGAAAAAVSDGKKYCNISDLRINPTSLSVPLPMSACKAAELKGVVNTWASSAKFPAAGQRQT